MSTSRSTAAPVRIDRILVVLGAVAAALVVTVIALLVLDHPLELSGRPGRATEVTFGPVIFVSTVAGAAGWGLLYVLERFTAHGKGIWTGVAVVVLLLSLIPVIFGDAEPGTRVTLVALHLVVGGILILGLRRTARRG